MSVVLGLLELLLGLEMEGCGATLALEIHCFHRIETFWRNPWLLEVLDKLSLHRVWLLLNHMLSGIGLGSSCLLCIVMMLHGDGTLLPVGSLPLHPHLASYMIRLLEVSTLHGLILLESHVHNQVPC